MKIVSEVKIKCLFLILLVQKKIFYATFKVWNEDAKPSSVKFTY